MTRRHQEEAAPYMTIRHSARQTWARLAFLSPTAIFRISHLIALNYYSLATAFRVQSSVDMGKRAHKRQKTKSATSITTEPLGTYNASVSLLDDASKDDEERLLESVLFGKKYVPASANSDVLVLSDDEGNGADPGGAEFQTAPDADVSIFQYTAVTFYLTKGQLFFIDDNIGGGASVSEDVRFEADLDEDEQDEEDEENSAQSEGHPNETDIVSHPTEVGIAYVSGSRRKGPAWVDPDDGNLTISLTSNKRLRKLRDALAEDEVGGKEYERKLRRQFEKTNPRPEWTNKARAKSQSSKPKRRRQSHSSDEESALDENLNHLFSSTGGILGSRPTTLRQGTLAIERLRDANLSAPSEDAVKAVQFHPSTQVPLMLTASEDRRLRFFNVGRPILTSFRDVETHVTG